MNAVWDDDDYDDKRPFVGEKRKIVQLVLLSKRFSLRSKQWQGCRSGECD